MTAAQAQALVAKIAAAWPRDWAFSPALTNDVYLQALSKLRQYEATLAAVDALIESEDRLPPIAMIRRVYAAKYVPPPALEPPEPTEEERAENVRRARDLAERLRSVGSAGNDTTDGAD